MLCKKYIVDLAFDKTAAKFVALTKERIHHKSRLLPNMLELDFVTIHWKKN